MSTVASMICSARSRSDSLVKRCRAAHQQIDRGAAGGAARDFRWPASIGAAVFGVLRLAELLVELAEHFGPLDRASASGTLGARAARACLACFPRPIAAAAPVSLPPLRSGRMKLRSSTLGLIASSSGSITSSSAGVRRRPAPLRRGARYRVCASMRLRPQTPRAVEDLPPRPRPGRRGRAAAAPQSLEADARAGPHVGV